VTPEYNRSVPPAIKGARDVGSRSGKGCAEQEAVRGRPRLARPDRRRRESSPAPVLQFLNMPAPPRPEAYIGGAESQRERRILNPSRANPSASFRAAFAAGIERRVHQ
jgi:NAD(P)H-dependent FMN reductase